MIKKIIKFLDLIAPKFIRNFRVKIICFFQKKFSPEILSSRDTLNFGEEGKHVFFGYYDITPFNFNDKLVLAMRAPLVNRTPLINDKVEVGFYNFENPKQFSLIGKTNTWCWQQGCRLQWYNENAVICNCMIDNNYGAIIKDMKGKTIKEIKKPIYSLSLDGNWGISLNFSRLQRLRPGYGYSILPDKTVKDYVPGYSGIELINVKTGENSLLFSLKDISKIEPHESMEGAEHYFNHIMFNPSGNRFLFFHLWKKGRKRYSRLFTANRDGSKISLLNNSGCVSHYNWISENEIILYSYILEKGYVYAIFNDLDRSIKYFRENIPKEDGHPTFFKKNNILITDTYPDLFIQRKLLKYQADKDNLNILARFDSPVFFRKEIRCDLHPRVSHNREMICVDCIINNKRHISIIPF